MKKTGTITLRVFTGFSETKKALGIRMGKGKGSHSTWICPVRKGQIVCEVNGNSDFSILKALKSAESKLPLKAKVFRLLY